MSLADSPPRPTPATSGAADPERRPRPSAALRLFGSELRLVFGRRRNQVLLLALAAIPVLVGVAVRLTASRLDPGEGPPFLDRVSGNGLFLVFTALVASIPLFLPLAVGIVSGDAVAGEANVGTLRYLLTVPVSRTRLLLVKGLASFTFALVAVLTVALVGLGVGSALFGLGDTTLLSGDTIPLSEGLVRGLGIAVYVTLSLSGLVAVGLFASTLTEVPVAAMATTVVIAVASQVLDALPQLNGIDDALLTHHWLALGEFLRPVVDVGRLAEGLQVQVAWVVVAGALAWARLTSADVTS